MMEGLTAAAPEGGTPQLCGADIEMAVLEGKLGLWSSGLEPPI